MGFLLLQVAQSLGGKIPWRKKWQPTLVFLPGESHGQRTLAGYSPQRHKESDTTEATQHTRTAEEWEQKF